METDGIKIHIACKMRRSCLFRRSAVKVIFLASRGIMIPAQAHFLIRDLDLDRTDCIPLINTGIYPVAHENIGYFHQTHPFKKTFPADTAFDMQQEPSGNMILSIKRSFRFIQIEHRQFKNFLFPSDAKFRVVKTVADGKGSSFHPDPFQRMQVNQNIIQRNNQRTLMNSVRQRSPVQVKNIPLKTGKTEIESQTFQNSVNTIYFEQTQ